jgi:hypothetical protein
MHMRRITPSLVIAVVALVLACTGGAAAATKLITGTQIKDSSLTGADIKNTSLGGDDLRSESIGPSKLSLSVQDMLEKAGSPGPAGPAGPAGAAGPAGPAGPAGTASVTRTVSAHQSLPPGGFTSSMRADCPAGMVVVGTGFNTGIGNADFVLSYGTFVGAFIDNDTSITIEAWVQALCAPGSNAGGASSLTGERRAADASSAFERDEAAARANR